MRPVDADLLTRLPDLFDQVQRLEAEVRDLRAQLAARPGDPVDEFISIDDAAELTGIGREALWKRAQRNSKSLPAEKRGRQWFVLRSAAAALASKKVQP